MATNTTASFTDRTGNGTAGPFHISFLYIEQSEVDVTVDGVLKTLGTHYTFTSTSQITFTSGNEPANGAAIKFTRDTDISAKKVDFEDGSVLTENDLDTQNDQLLFGLQEINGQLSSISNGLKVSLDNTVDSGSVTGAVERTLTDKLADIVNAADFGAKGDGVTDDTLSLQNAINFCITNSGKELQLNAGVYVITKDLLAVLDEKFEQLHIKGNGNVILKCLPTLTTLSTIAIANKNTGVISTGPNTDFLLNGVVGNVSIRVSNSSASGNTGGFNTGQNYIHFAYDNQIHGATADTGERSVALTPIDASNFEGNGKVTRIEIDAIIGNNNNGGEYPDISSPATDGEYLELRYSTDNGTNWILIGQIIPIKPLGTVPSGINRYFLDIPESAQVNNVSFQLHQPSNTTVDNYGITNIRYLNCSASNFLDVTISTNQYASNLNAPRFSIRNIEFAYANETTSQLANGINLKGSTLQGVPTQTCVIESCQFVPWTTTANSILIDTFFSNAVKINNLGEVSFKNCNFYGEHDQESVGTDGKQLGVGVSISTTSGLLVGSYFFDACSFTYGDHGIRIDLSANTVFVNNCIFQQNRKGIFFKGTGGLRVSNSAFTNSLTQPEPANQADPLISHFCIHTFNSKEIQISNSFFSSGKDLTSNPAGQRTRGCLLFQDSGIVNIHGNLFKSTSTNVHSNYRNLAISIENPSGVTTDSDGQIQGNSFFDFNSSLHAIFLALNSEIQCYEELNVFHNCGNNITNQGGNNVVSLPSAGATSLSGLTDVTLSSVTNGQVLKYNGTAWINDTDNTGSSGTATVDLSQTITGSDYKILSSTNHNNTTYVSEIYLAAATTSTWGVMTDEDKTALDSAILDGDFTSNGFMKRTGAGTYTVDTNTYLTSIPSSYLQNVSEDTTPQLGGNLDMQSYEITTSTTNGNIILNPNGNGVVEIKGDGTTTGTVGTIKLNCSNNNHGVQIASPPHSAGASYTLTLPNTDGNANQVLKTDGSGGLDWVDQASGGATDKISEGNTEAETVDTGSDGHFKVTTEGTERLRVIADGKVGIGTTTPSTVLEVNGSFKAGGLAYPTSDGSANQVLKTDGSGTLSFVDQASGGGLSSDAQNNTVGGTNAGDSFTGTDAINNTLIGYDAGTGITTGDHNTIIGSGAGSVNNGFSNVYIGYRAGQGTTYNAGSCYNNVCIGYDAGKTYTGVNSILIGTQAGKDMTTGEKNIVIGADAGQSMTTGEWSVIMGYEAGKSLETGSNSTLIGYQSGDSITSGTGNVCIGKGAGGYASPSGTISTGSYNVVLGNNSTQNLYCADTSISSSDSRDKADVTSFNIGLAWIEALRPVTYRWDRRTWYGTDEQPYGTPDGSKKRSELHIGFLAQEALAVEQANGYGADNNNSLAVHLNEDGMSYGMKYERLVPILVNAIKELSTRVQALEAG